MIAVTILPSGKKQLVELIPEVATYAALLSYIQNLPADAQGKKRPGHILVTADETSLDASNNPQRQTYWYDGFVLWYPALSRADGTVTSSAGNTGLQLIEVTNNSVLGNLANPAATTIYQVDADTNNAGQVGFYFKLPNGDLYWVAAQKI